MSPTIETIGTAILAICALALFTTLVTITFAVDHKAPVSLISRELGDTRTDEEILLARYRAQYGEDGDQVLEAVRRRARLHRATRERRAAEARGEDMMAYTENVQRQDDSAKNLKDKAGEEKDEE